MATDWDIRPRASVCAQCDAEFQDRQDCFSVLRFTDEEGYVRADYCAECWTAKPPDDRGVSMWKGLFLLPPPPEAEALEQNTAESLLRRLMDEDPESHANVIYILAVMLERKRQFIERATQTRDDVLIRVYEYRKTGETFLIRDPMLSLDELEPVQEQVVALLGGGEKPAEEKQETDSPGESEGAVAKEMPPASPPGESEGAVAKEMPPASPPGESEGAVAKEMPPTSPPGESEGAVAKEMPPTGLPGGSERSPEEGGC
ncbi:MAG: hypothetical protein ISS31_10950 [Kiritimatiellae bacterium]|nr:hypothetical protein [Kiritimatiellia bacterium]